MWVRGKSCEGRVNHCTGIEMIYMFTEKQVCGSLVATQLS